MPTATQTFATGAGGTNWGLILELSAGPSYGLGLVSGGYDPEAMNFGGGQINRGVWELDMAVLVANGYVPGTPLIGGSLTLTLSGNTGAAVKMGLGNSNLGAAASAIFAAADDGTDLPGFSGTGAKTYTFSAGTLTAIAALGGTDKRLIGMALNNEGGGGQVTVDRTVACVLTVEWANSQKSRMMLLGVGG